MLSAMQSRSFNKAYESYRKIRSFIAENVDVLGKTADDVSELLMKSDLELEMVMWDVSSLDSRELSVSESEFIKSLADSADDLKNNVPGYAKVYRNMTSENYKSFKDKADVKVDVLLGVETAVNLKEKIGKNHINEIITAYQDILNAYSEMNEFKKNEILAKVAGWIGIQSKAAGDVGVTFVASVSGGSGMFASASAFATEDHSVEEYQGELADLVGLDEVKTDVNEMVNILKVNELRKKQGIPPISVAKHMVFTGNPGTGKTTVARILAGIYKQLGVLSKGHLVEVDRSGLVAAHIGGTEEKTMNVIESAMGGVLFIDEAYSLSGEGNDFGQYAIDTLIKAMEDRRDDLVVIAAGYPQLMNDFLESNPGLRSRFTKFISFSDYDADEMQQIFVRMIKKDGFSLADGAEELLMALWNKATTEEDFGNGRGVRNVYEDVLTNQSTRVININNPTKEDLLLICKEDIPVKLETGIDEVPQDFKGFFK